MLVSFWSCDGEFVTEDLADAWVRPFERLAPVRRLVQFKGQRNFTGAWWCAKTGAHVGFESWVERDQLMLLDFAPEVVGIGSQPFAIDLQTASGPRRHVPDYFVRQVDGSVVVIDVRPDGLVGDDDVVFEATAQACALVGWGYRRLGRPMAVLVENVRWLAGYRHPRCARPQLRAQALELVGEAGLPLGDLAWLLGGPVTTLATLFHMLWNHELRTEIQARPLSMGSLVQAGG